MGPLLEMPTWAELWGIYRDAAAALPAGVLELARDDTAGGRTLWALLVTALASAVAAVASRAGGPDPLTDPHPWED